nr:hypothetical protein [uncultured Methanobrevibacter sp.]
MNILNCAHPSAVKTIISIIIGFEVLCYKRPDFACFVKMVVLSND